MPLPGAPARVSRAYEEFLQSYDVYDYASDKELEDAYGEEWNSHRIGSRLRVDHVDSFVHT